MIEKLMVTMICPVFDYSAVVCSSSIKTTKKMLKRTQLQKKKKLNIRSALLMETNEIKFPNTTSNKRRDLIICTGWCQAQRSWIQITCWYETQDIRGSCIRLKGAYGGKLRKQLAKTWWGLKWSWEGGPWSDKWRPSWIRLCTETGQYEHSSFSFLSQVGKHLHACTHILQ